MRLDRNYFENVQDSGPHLQEGESGPLELALCITNFSVKLHWGEKKKNNADKYLQLSSGKVLNAHKYSVLVQIVVNWKYRKLIYSPHLIDKVWINESQVFKTSSSIPLHKLMGEVRIQLAK